MQELYWVVIGLLLLAILLREIGWRLRLRRTVRDQAAESLNRSRAVLKGQIGEQLAPLLPEFPFHPGDVRFVGGVVDLLVFVGYHAGQIDEVVLADVKTGGARLTPIQRQVAQAIEEGRVRFATIRIE